MTVFLWIIGAPLALLLIFTVFGGLIMCNFAVGRRRLGKESVNWWEEDGIKFVGETEEDKASIARGIEFLRSRELKRHYIESHDGLKLCGHMVEHPNPRGVILQVHGYRSCGLYDFSSAAEAFYSMGFSCLVIDQRAHGYSEGKYIGFGALERYDVVRWCEYIRDTMGLPVILDGVSMGSATVLMGLTVGYPDNVRAIIADCGYTTPGAICRKVLKQWFRLPPFPLYHGAKMWVKALAGYDFDGVSSCDGIKKAGDINILIAHGGSDDFVPYSMAEEIFAAYEGDPQRIEFFTSPEAGHGLSFLKDRDGYMAAIDRLVEKSGF